MENYFANVAVIGGGAAGLVCAVTCAKKDKNRKVIIIEKEQRVGKKILATGNGRCNLTNMNASPENYHGSFQKGVENLLKGIPPSEVLSFFEDIGLFWKEEDEGRVYPYSNQASSVLDVLRLALDRLGVEEKCGCAVKSVSKKGNKFSVVCDGCTVTAEKVVVCTGGKASEKLGSDGSGLKFLKEMGHTITPLYPSLVPVSVKNPYMKSLKGIRCMGEVSLADEKGKIIKKEHGEIQFGEKALSGICVFNLSSYVGEIKKPRIYLNLFPEYDFNTLVDLLFKRRKMLSENTLEDFFTGMIHKRIGFVILKDVLSKNLSQKVGTLTKADIKQIAQTLTKWEFECTVNMNFSSAQVTKGGVSGKEIDPYTMESKKVKGLYICGEAADVDGDCGGYNLQFAFSSGIMAGRMV